MSPCRSSNEDCAARRLRQIQQDIHQGTFVDWANDEEIAARGVDMERNMREEVRRSAPRQTEAPTAGGSRPQNPTFVGLINPQCSYSHNMQGTVPLYQDHDVVTLLTNAHRVVDQFCEEFPVLKAEVAILEVENADLRRILKNYLTPLSVVPPSPPQE